MIFFDVTKSRAAGHRSGLTRVSGRLIESLGSAATAVTWDPRARLLKGGHGAPQAGDWFLTAELFSEEERPGFTEFIARRACRMAAIFHDAIPLQLPHVTWPQSVARHPGYLKLLARFDHVWAVSQASRDELIGYWRWLGIERMPTTEVLALGADFNAAPRVIPPPPNSAEPELMCIGIIEPRKNQSLLLDVCEALWRDQVRFKLHVVGRVNPHFGAPIATRLQAMSRTHRGRLQYHDHPDDGAVARLYSTARATVFPTLAEGCGLPLLESLWMGVPCVCSDLPVLRENASAGGCLLVPVGDPGAWQAAVRQIVTDDALHARLRSEAATRPLPAWAAAAKAIAAKLR